MESSRLALLCILALGVSTGCGPLPSGRGWGENAIYPVNGPRIVEAARNAVLDPLTWVPLAGAGVIAVGGWDDSISDWASRETPLFGSIGRAQNYSDIARAVLYGEALGSALLTPSGPDAGQWLWNKTRGLAVGAGALGLTSLQTSALKEAIHRERPDLSNHLSMPSGHASSAFSAAVLANRNLDYVEMNNYARAGWKAANVALAGSVAWARVEGQQHFPTDVLVGAALGNFTTRFIYDAFIGTRPNDRFSVYVEPGWSRATVSVAWEF